MNFLAQFEAVFAKEHRAVAKLVKRQNGQWLAATVNGGHPVLLKGGGDFGAGQTVFYDQTDGRIIESAPDLQVADIQVQ